MHTFMRNRFPGNDTSSPFVGIQTAMTRMVNPVHPEYERYDGRILGSEAEKLELKDLIEGYSIASAYQCFVDDVTGSLEKGKSADFVILDKDITQTDVKEMWNIKVEKTFFKGREVYSLE